MGFNAVVFPGQGAQKQGMAKDFVERFEEAKHAFEDASNILSFDPYQVCFDDPDTLNQTAYTQPCIILCEAAMYQSLKMHFGLAPTVFAGHSLGEYAALFAAGVLPLDLTLKLVSKRGELMQNTPVDGAMAAVIMDEIPHEKLSVLADQHQIDVANDNSISQVVLSGEKKGLDELISVLEETFNESIRIVKLNVSAPFHSRYMKDIEETFHDFLKQHAPDFNVKPLKQVVSNYLGGFYQGDLDELLMALSKQLSGAVKWRDNMTAVTQKTTQILELGPNRPLRGFFKTMNVDITSIVNVRQVDKVFSNEAV